MSINFEIMKGARGWRFESDRRLDLSDWDIVYDRDTISCTPRPMEFVYMAFGAIVFLAIAIYILLLAINPSWLGQTRKRLSWETPSKVNFIFPLAMIQQPERSKYQQDTPTLDDIRESTIRLIETLTEDMTAEEKAEFIAGINEKAHQNQRSAAAPRARIDGMLAWLVLLGRVLAIIPISLFSLLGGVCLNRALRFFHDRVELSVRENTIVVRRAKLFGGVHERSRALNELAAITCYAVRHRRRRRHGSRGYVQWIVQLSGKTREQSSLEFDLEHLSVDASLTAVPSRVSSFAAEIRKLTRLPVLQRRPVKQR